MTSSDVPSGQATPAIRTADILIVGGGLSGTLLAMQLLRLPGARHIVVLEPRAELGRGEAYSATELGHTLNGNAARMSVEPDDADDLTRWLQAHIAGVAGPSPGCSRCRLPSCSRREGCLVCMPASVWPKHRPSAQRRAQA